MSDPCVTAIMKVSGKPLTNRRFFVAAALLAAATPSTAASDNDRSQPIRFFEGKTEMMSTVKVIMKKPYASKTVGQGKILGDGSLNLVQQVEDEGKPASERRWRIKPMGDGRFAGTMSEAIGPIAVQEEDGQYRFRFKMKGGLEVDQLLTPMPGGKVAHSRAVVRKMGMRVAVSEGTIRKLS